VFRGQKAEVYELWGICSEYVVSFSRAVYQSYSISMQSEEPYIAFIEHQPKDRKPEHVAQKSEHVSN
jgi:hypothetical protein